ncbi:hypothetical protein ACEPPN_005888 [Leptodophora sp. 'Broadleaf-Isolate-01']
MWRNNARQRHLLIWEKLVMIYTQYHKGQQQSGAYKDNIRFIPKAIGDLLLPYIANRTLSACLTKAYARAKVPRLYISNWRQFVASITKEKFSVKERANFDLKKSVGEDIKDELDLVTLAELSNHTYHTFNHAYARTTTLTMNTLLHRNYRASESWRTFFRFDHILQGKRPRGASETLSLRMLDASKRGQMRRRGAYSEADLLAVARKLYNAPGLQFRVPAEQVVLVIGTGFGKTMVVMIGVAIADAETTILVLPMVALRGDMLRRFHEVGIRSLIWSVDCQRSASLVIVSAEAAFSKQKLNRIVVDEGHLTITARNYRLSTLPPVMEKEFIEHNKLVKPRIIRESTNRPNIKYMVSFGAGPGPLIERAANLFYPDP